jgi:hypothetical protein
VIVRFMTSGPIVVQVLEGENAVKTYRDVMGATDPVRRRPAPSAGAGRASAQLGARLDSVENAAIKVAPASRPKRSSVRFVTASARDPTVAGAKQASQDR